jgi:hypothetical protein
MEIWPVEKRVGNVANDDAGLIARVDAAPEEKRLL